MELNENWGLRLRMAFTLALLASVTVGLAWIIAQSLSYLIGFLTDGSLAPTARTAVGAGGAVLFVAAIAATEWRSIDSLVVRRLEIQPATVEEHPMLVGTVQRLAQQADLPTPTVKVAASASPNSFTTGLSASGATVVVTQGLLDRLDEDELAAVAAHELAHVKNRDAAVMTAASLPLVVAGWLNEWADDWWAASSRDGGDMGVLLFPLVFVASGLFWVVGRALVRALARSRELAADRGAVALVGSPAPLVAALGKLDERASDVPYDDLRRIDGAAHAFGIVEVDSEDVGVRLGPEGDRVPLTYRLTRPVRPLSRRLFATHPSVERRLASLEDLGSP